MTREIIIDIFHDERLLKSEQWLYHGLLFVPASHEARLIDQVLRLRNGYDGFVHFSEIRNPPADTAEGKKARVAMDWIRLLLSDTRLTRTIAQYNNFCALVLGINLKNLNRECFGAEADRNVFNRFFRTALISGIKKFYAGDFDRIVVRRVHHGTTEIADDNPLRWHPMWRIERDSDGAVVFAEGELALLAADHRKEARMPRQSHLIQFTDVVMGAFSQCLDFSSTSKGCIAIGEEVLPLVERLTKSPNNVNSRYYKKYSLSFFPSKKLRLADLGSIERQTSTFYTSRDLRVREHRQPRLFN